MILKIRPETLEENCRPRSLMNIDIKILTIQYIERITDHNQMGFICGMQG
jgi:hypothetical protein